MSWEYYWRQSYLWCLFEGIFESIDFPGGSDSKASCLQGERRGFHPWVGKILWRRKWQATPIFLPGKCHGQRSLAGYSPRGHKMKAKCWSLNHVRLFATPWTVACQAPPSMGFSRQEYWSGVPFPSPEYLPDPGLEPRSAAL